MEKRVFEIKVVSIWTTVHVQTHKIINDYNLHVYVHFIFAKVVAMQYD